MAAETSVHDAEDNPGCCRSDTLHVETSSSNGFLLCASCCVSESGSLMEEMTEQDSHIFSPEVLCTGLCSEYSICQDGVRTHTYL